MTMPTTMKMKMIMVIKKMMLWPGIKMVKLK